MNPLAGLYTPEFIEKLRQLAARARSEFAIQRNFITLLEAMTSTYTFSKGPISDEAKPRMEAFKQILSVVWAGATAAMVQPSTVRTLREVRESLDGLIAGDDRFSFRKWWPIAEDAAREADSFSGPDFSDEAIEKE